jgi:hypothetical protein
MFGGLIYHGVVILIESWNFKRVLAGVFKSAGRRQVNALNCSVRCPQRISSETSGVFG